MKSFFDAFISYGRTDSKAFATKLHNRLTEQGLQVWFDQNDIPLGVDFQNQINNGIQKAHNFIFIITPYSLKSPYCLKEILQAVKYNKRIIPLLYIEPQTQELWDKMHPTIRKINWIDFQEAKDNFEESFAGLMNLVAQNTDYVEQHTKFLVKALEWERNQKQTNYLLIGEERIQAESWLKVRFKDEQPPCEPTDLHCEFICESTKNANNLMTQVFVSHSEKDKEITTRVSQILMRHGFTIWTNKTDIKTGTAFQDEINQGIEQADNLVYLISPDSIQSKYCQDELAYAFEHNKRIISLLIEPIDLEQIPSKIRTLQFIDFTDYEDVEKYQIATNKLLKALNQDAYYYEQHKVLLVKALKWLRQNRNLSILLRGYNLQLAEAWLKAAKQRPEHPPLPLHEEFIAESIRQPTDLSLEVFVSYSRADSDFARKLNEALQIQGKITWFDQESIALGTDFQQEIYRGIESSDNFLFIISPSSVNSPYCASEVEYAQKLNKRLVTVLHRDVPPNKLHPGLARVQWIDFNRHGGDFYANFSELVRTLDTDREHIRSHTKWLQRALEWEQKDKSADLLLRESEFAIAQNWLQEADQQNKQPAATNLQQEYIAKSQEAIVAGIKNEKRRVVILRSLLGLVSTALVVTVGVGIVAFGQYQKAKSLLEDQINAQSRYSNVLTDSHQEFDALIEGIRAGQLRKQLSQIKSETRLQLIESLERAVQGVTERNRLEGHQGKVNHSDFSPNYQMIATAGEDKTVKLWNWNGKQLNTLRHDDEVDSVKFSPDSQILATKTKDNTIKLWSVNGQELKTLRPNYPVMGMSFSPDSQMIVTYGQDKTAKLWNRDDQEPQLLQHNADVYGVSFTSDSQMIATYSQDKTVKLWNLDGRELKTLRHADEVYGVVFSPNNQMIATASKDKTAKLWNLEGKELKTLRHTDAVNGVVFSPDSPVIVTYSKDYTAKLWGFDGRELKTLQHNNEVYGVRFSPDHQIIVTYSRDKTAKLWSLDGKELQTLRHADEVWVVSFSPDGKTIATRSKDKTAKVWSLNGEEIQTLWHQEEVWDGNFSPDGKTIATRSKDKSVQLWSRSSQYFKTLQGHDDWINDVSFSPDGKTIATSSKDKTVKLWSQNGKELKTLIGHKEQVWDVGFSPDGKMLATRSNDKTVKLWSVDGQEFTTFKEQYSFTFSPDGKTIGTANAGTVTLWSLKGEQLKVIKPHDQMIDIDGFSFSLDGKMIAIASAGTVTLWSRDGYRIRTLTGYQDQVKRVLFSPDGKTIATASADKTVKLWSREGKLLYTLTGHQDQVNGMVFSPDSTAIATRSIDNIVKLWNLDGKEIRTLPHGEKIYRFGFSPDSKMIAIASEDRTVKLWSRDGEPLQTLWHDSAVSRISFSPDSRMIASVSNQNALTVWNLDRDKLYTFANRDLYLDHLMGDACDWVSDYLHNKPKKDSDRLLCDSIE